MAKLTPRPATPPLSLATRALERRSAPANEAWAHRGPPTNASRAAMKKGLLRNHTADKRPICFHYNQEKGCKRDACTFAHVCARCFGSHPYGPDCPKYVKI